MLDFSGIPKLGDSEDPGRLCKALVSNNNATLNHHGIRGAVNAPPGGITALADAPGSPGVAFKHHFLQPHAPGSPQLSAYLICPSLLSRLFSSLWDCIHPLEAGLSVSPSDPSSNTSPHATKQIFLDGTKSFGQTVGPGASPTLPTTLLPIFAGADSSWMSRLASLQPRNRQPSSNDPSAPSSPASSSPKSRPSGRKPSTPRQRSSTPDEYTEYSTPTSPGVTETSHHRFLRLLLAEVRKVCSTWEDIVLVDGLKAGKGCVDEATEMDNILLSPLGSERAAIGNHLGHFYEYQRAVNGVLRKLERLQLKLSALVDQAEKLFFEAYRMQGGEFVLEAPMWFSWSFERFVDSLSPLLSQHNIHLHHLRSLSDQFTDPQTPFEQAKSALEQWRDLGRGGDRWETVRDWEELVDMEITCGQDEQDEEPYQIAPSSSTKKKGR